jgi:YfiH family protein
MSYITFKIFNQFPELVCAFSGRQGGVSRGIYSSFNLGGNTGDSAEAVERNRQFFFNKLGIEKEKVAFAEQIHSSNIGIVDKPGTYPKTDAMICGKEDIFLTIQTADCFPIFVYVPAKKVIAVIHAGWQGVALGIVKNVLQILYYDFNILPSDLHIAIGPGIQRECFEVGEDVYPLFPIEYLADSPVRNKKYLNLQDFIVNQLMNDWSVTKSNIYVDSSCTKCMAKEYYSYRRDGVQSGRMMGIIGIKKGVR